MWLRVSAVPALYEKFFRKFCCPEGALLYVPTDSLLAAQDIAAVVPRRAQVHPAVSGLGVLMGGQTPGATCVLGEKGVFVDWL